MNLKSTCIYVTTAVALLASLAPSPGWAEAAGAPVVTGGGQAPPNPSGGSGAFSVRVATNIPQSAAEALTQELIQEGYTATIARPAGDGTYEVVLPNLATRNQADALLAELKSSGYTPDSIIEGAGIATTGTTAAPTGDSIFRVLVAEFESAEEANDASTVLVDDGFVNVDVVPENGKHMLMLGTFNRRADAEALLTDVNSAGFALASVVSRERLRAPDAGAVSDAELSGLSAPEQQRTRDVLAMAEKVESGEASAEEIKQLRESIQQLSENQKAILGRQESNRSADREKLQRIFQLYRQFDQALKSNDLTAAEQALAEVKQIDPSEMFLANRLQALEAARSGGSTGAPSTAAPSAVDPAEVQRLLNEARAAQNSENSTEAAGKYRQVLALDPSNVEARSRLGDLEGPAPTDEQSDGTSGLMENKPLLYGGAGLLAVIAILWLWMRSRKAKAAAAEPTPAPGVNSFSMGSSAIDPLSTGSPSGSPTINSTPATGSVLAGAGMAGFATMHADDDEEEPEAELPAPAAAPPAPVEESDTVSFEEMEETPAAPAPPADPPPAAASQDDEMVSLNFGDELVKASAEEPPAAAASSSMDADLEALLKGTFEGSPEAEAPPAGGAVAATAAAGSSAGAEATVVYEQSFANATSGSAPEDWRGEYDYASLTVASPGGNGHEQALKYEKAEGAGSATYHLSFPPAKGRVVAEFDIRCDEKNKFLLGVYLERDEDFKQSIHTIVHQLDPNAPASLRIQGEAVPYQLGTWSRIRYDADLINGTLDCYMDDEHVVRAMHLPVTPEFVNTLSIRDNLATTGTLYLDNIRISEA